MSIKKSLMEIKNCLVSLVREESDLPRFTSAEYIKKGFTIGDYELGIACRNTYLDIIYKCLIYKEGIFSLKDCGKFYANFFVGSSDFEEEKWRMFGGEQIPIRPIVVKVKNIRENEEILRDYIKKTSGIYTKYRKFVDEVDKHKEELSSNSNKKESLFIRSPDWRDKLDRLWKERIEVYKLIKNML